jgi:hypothetical protein
LTKNWFPSFKKSKVAGNSNLAERLLEVDDQTLCVFDAERDAHQSGLPLRGRSSSCTGQD